MASRILFGAILIAALLGLVWLDHVVAGLYAPEWAGPLRVEGGRWSPGVVLLLLGLLAGPRAGYELARIARACGVNASSGALSLCGLAGVACGGLCVGQHPPVGEWSGAVLATGAGGAFFFTMLAYIRRKDVKGAGSAVAWGLTAFVYSGVLLGFLLALRREHSIGAMLGVICIVKACDSGAYFTGKAVGRHKLIPWLSPGKTWEGLFGGVLTAVAAGTLLAWAAEVHGGLAPGVALTLWQGALLGGILGVLGQAGDLAESVLKRDAGVKDAGRILPAFGGVLDMLDSLLLTAPAAFWLLILMRG